MHPSHPVSALIIEEDGGNLDLLSQSLAQPGLEVLASPDPREGLELFFHRRPQIVIADLQMNGVSGMDLLERILGEDPAAAVILMAAEYSTESAVEAIKKGASDYLNKPVAISRLQERVLTLADEARRRRRAQEIEEELRSHSEFEGIIGRSPQMWELVSRVRRVAPHYRTLLITGETGTGKDLIARAVHKFSPAAAGRYVVLNCSAVVETLFESELFGHVKGAFTGATHDKPGLFEHAHGGTLFLDEIGDMPLTTQAKLLRVLQNQEVQRVGALGVRKVDVRVIAATNRDLRAAIAEQRFREDLYYRLSMVEIQMPRLADRKEDLALLQRHFMARFASEYGKGIDGVTRRAEIVLARHSWPGNVRELENVIGHAVMLAAGNWIDIQDLPAYLRNQASPEKSESPAIITLEEQERMLLTRAMQAAKGNQSKAARMLRIGRDALRYKLKQYKLDKEPPEKSSIVCTS